MKKIFIILAMAILTSGLLIQASGGVLSNGDVEYYMTTSYASTESPLSENKITSLAASDIIEYTDSTFAFNIYPQTGTPYIYYIVATFDSLAGTPLLPVVLQGKMSLLDASWTTITTVNWYGHTTAGTATDTVIIFDGTTVGKTETFIFDTTKTFTGNGAIANRKAYYATVTDNTPLYPNLRVYCDLNTKGITTAKCRLAHIELKAIKK
jgi:hypothetical protein